MYAWITQLRGKMDKDFLTQISAKFRQGKEGVMYLDKTIHASYIYDHGGEAFLHSEGLSGNARLFRRKRSSVGAKRKPPGKEVEEEDNLPQGRVGSILQVPTLP